MWLELPLNHHSHLDYAAADVFRAFQASLTTGTGGAATAGVNFNLLPLQGCSSPLDAGFVACNGISVCGLKYGVATHLMD